MHGAIAVIINGDVAAGVDAIVLTIATAFRANACVLAVAAAAGAAYVDWPRSIQCNCPVRLHRALRVHGCRVRDDALLAHQSQIRHALRYPIASMLDCYC